MAQSSVRQLRSRTVPMRPTADAPYRSGSVDDPTRTDPLGIDAMTRGMENAWTARLATGSPIGPLPDPRWAGYFQTLADRGVDRIGVDAGSSRPGTAGDALAEVADSMSDQSGSIEALRKATRQQKAKAAAKAAAAEPAPPAPRTATLPPPRDPTLGPARVQAGLLPGSLAALQRRT